MDIPWVDISSDAYLEWQWVRQILGDGLEFCMKDPNLPIHRHWIYEIDPYSMLGKVTAPMYVTDGDDKGKIHAWTIGIRSADMVKGADGETNIIGRGGSQWHWMLSMALFLFVGNDGTPGIQQKAENE